MEEVVGSNPISPTNQTPRVLEINTILSYKGIDGTDFKIVENP